MDCSRKWLKPSGFKNVNLYCVWNYQLIFGKTIKFPFTEFRSHMATFMSKNTGVKLIDIQIFKQQNFVQLIRNNAHKYIFELLCIIEGIWLVVTSIKTHKASPSEKEKIYRRINYWQRFRKNKLHCYRDMNNHLAPENLKAHWRQQNQVY